MRRVLRVIGFVLLALVLLLGLAVLVVPRTQWGRNLVRNIAVSSLQGIIDGEVSIGEIRGSLFSGVTLINVVIRDANGGHFLTVDTLSTRYALGDILGRRYVLRDTRLVSVDLLLDQRDGERWNYEKILRIGADTSARPDTTTSDMILRFEDADIVGSRMALRTPWRPDSLLNGARRDSAIAAALSDSSLMRVEAVGNGFQMVQEYEELNAALARVSIVDPAESALLVGVTELGAVLVVFRGGNIRLVRAASEITLRNDTLLLANLDLLLPRSSAAGELRFVFDAGRTEANLQVDSLTGSDLSWLRMGIPPGLTSSFALDARLDADSATYALTNLELREGGALAAGRLTLAQRTVGEMSLDADLRIDSLEAELIRELAPQVKLPADGVFHGRAEILGPLSSTALRVDLTFDDVLSGSSHLVAVGGVGFGDAVVLRNLLVTVDTVAVAVARNFTPTFPLGGTVAGTMLLNGDISDTVSAEVNLKHDLDGKESNLSGNVVVAMGDTIEVDAELTVAPFQLAVMRSFAPDATVYNEVSGSVTLRGTLAALATNLQLEIAGGGRLSAPGTLDLASESPGYDLTLVLDEFNLAAVMDSAPITSVSADASITGRGVDPASLLLDAELSVRNSTVPEIGVDTMHTRVRLASGVLAIDTLLFRTPGAMVTATGNLGITDSTTGALSLRARVDSLSPFAKWIPSDTGVVLPSASRVREAYRLARADSARRARESEIRREITGEAAPTLALDLPQAFPRDSLAGQILFDGMLTGSISVLRVTGDVAATDVVASGMTVERADVSLDVGWRADSSTFTVAANGVLLNATALGYSVDSTRAQVGWDGASLDLDATVVQRDGVAIDTDLTLRPSEDSTSLALRQLVLRLDSVTTWRSRRESRIAFGNAGYAVDSLFLTTDSGGSILLDGHIAESGSGRIYYGLFGVELGGLMRAAQSGVDMTGVIGVGGEITGNMNAPAFTGAAGLVDATFGENPLPDVHTTFGYTPGSLRANLVASSLFQEPFLTGSAEIPLLISRDSGFVVPGRPISSQFVFDRVPLELLPDVTSNLSQMRGELHGELSVAGTISDPVVTGDITVADASARVNMLGVVMQRISAHLLVRDDSLFIDSLRAYSGGPVNVEGTLSLAELTKPGFDLTLSAREAYVLNNANGKLRADVDLTMRGPFDSTAMAGNIRILDGVVYIPEFSNKQVLLAQDSLLLVVVDTTSEDMRRLYEPPNPFVENLDVRIGLQVARDTWVRSREANVELFSDDTLVIFLPRASSNLQMEGVLNVERGQYTYFGKRFEVKRGSATFIGGVGGINPTLQITGDHEVAITGRGNVTISVVIGGTMLQPRLALETDAQPPLSQSDMMSYLAFGRSSGSLLSLGASGLASGGLQSDAGQAIAGIALGAAVNEAEGEGIRSLGLDLFNINPAESYSEIARGSVLNFFRQTEFEAGKYFAGRTFVAAQLKLSGTPGVRAIHRTPKGFRIEMSWQPRLLLREPTLSEQRSVTKRAFSLFLFREWRF